MGFELTFGSRGAIGYGVCRTIDPPSRASLAAAMCPPRRFHRVIRKPAVHTWHISELSFFEDEVRLRTKSGIASGYLGSRCINTEFASGRDMSIEGGSSNTQLSA